MSISKADITQKILNHYLQNFREDNDDIKKIFKSLADANTKIVILSLIEYMNVLEIDQKYLELLKLLNYIISHIKESHFQKIKEKIHEFIERSVETSISLSKKINIPKEVVAIYVERDQLVENMISSILKFGDNDTVRLILNFFNAGKVPELIIMNILRILIREQGRLIKDYSNELLSKFLSTCTLVQSPRYRQIYADTMLLIYDNLSLCVENQDELNLKSLEDLSISIYSMISQDWISQPDYEVQSAAVNLIGYMVQFFPNNQIEKIADKIIDEFINQMKKQADKKITIWKGFNKILEKLLQTNKPYFEHSIKSIQVKLYDLYRSPIFSPNYEFDPEQQKKKNSLLEIIQNLAQFNIDSILDLYISRHQSKEIIEKIASLWITNFLINRNYEKISIPMKKLLINSLSSISFDSNFEVRYALIEIIFTLCNQKQFFEDSLNDQSYDISFMLFFLIKQVSIHPQEIAEKKNVRFAPFLTTLENLKSRSQYVLQILTTNSVQTTKNFIWPYILEYIPNPSFSPGLSSILKSTYTYLTKYKEVYNEYPQGNIRVNEKIPKIGTILARLIILLRIPQFFKGLGQEILKSIPHILSVFLTKECSKEINIHINDLEFIIQNESEDEKKLSDKIYQLWKVLLDQFDSNEWFTSMHEDLIAMNPSYNKVPELQVHMMKLHGLILTKIDSQETIKTQIDKFVTQVYNDYSNQQVNLNIDKIEPSTQMKLCLADTLALISTEKLDLVIDKIRNIMNSQIIQKKQQTGFASVLSMFNKPQTEEDALYPITSNLILSLGYICNRLNTKKLVLKIESHIINNLIPFLDKGGEEMQLCVHRTMEMISNGVIRIWNDCEEEEIKDLKRVFIKYKEKFYQRSILAFKTSKIPNIKTIAWETVSNLLRVDPPYSFEQHLNFFKNCIKFLEENINILSSFEQPTIHLFQAMLSHQKLVSNPSKNPDQTNSEEGSQEQTEKVFGDENGIVSVWEVLSTIIKIIEQNRDLEILCFYYNCLLKALFDKKLKANEGKDIKFLTVILVIFLSHIYKPNRDLQTVSLFCLEKIMLGLNIYLDVNMRDIEVFNNDLIRQLSQKLSFEELQSLVNESVQRVSQEENVQVLNGFTSLHNKFYNQHEEKLSEQLGAIIQSYKAVFDVQVKLNSEEMQKDQLIGYVITILEKNLQKGLDILLDEKVTFPLTDFQERLLKRIVDNKSTLFKTFNHLTDVLNNPEDKIFKCKGDALTNSIIFIGFMFSLNSEILLNITKKYFASIFGTFVLRFSTSFDQDLNKNSQSRDEMDASKACLWAFKQMLQNSNKSNFLNDISTGLQVKLIDESLFEDGMSELMMIVSKNSRLCELSEMMEFLKPFILKKIKTQKSACLIIVSQLIHCSFFALDFQDTRNHVLLPDWYNFLIDVLLANNQDSSEQIRSIVLRGIGNITYLHKYNIAGCLEDIKEEEDQNVLQSTENMEDNQNKKDKDENSQSENEGERNSQRKQLLDEKIAENLVQIIQDEEQKEFEKKKEPIFLISNERYAQIIEALFLGMDDTSDLCVKDTLNSLQNMIQFISDLFLQPYIFSLIQKVTINFEKQLSILRVTSFNLFGKLLEKIHICKEKDDYIQNQIHYVLISVIVHLLDESRQVRDVCKLNLEKIAKILNFEQLIKYLGQEDYNQIEEFKAEFLEKDEIFMLNAMSLFTSNYHNKITAYIETLTEYTKSPDEKIKCSSILSLIYTFRYLNQDIQNLEIIQNVKERLYELLEKQSVNRKINNIDKYILKATIFLIKTIES
ncbi:hypothetical protein TTHERM_00522740 (macronuclear) [Tetrahymena thermophila SB210]|uniref:HEAT repeat protein n=1 Tax=Tetrahymena thermophila (strain SB210) TaxID=312017 RepID=I7M143_TETTS|nr:hypothetical protein TTHERM_00522740 [Tetrahymena thermophila SB210]EAR94207.2 hypothetical protein TTHERM_00522740 [Tetrahymena thermophila SB210]|eukprot:XP_001014452.2 hypothetical protein TTHERM_00522740 [Tetrahymena thermophila SB210]